MDGFNLQPKLNIWSISDGDGKQDAIKAWWCHQMETFSALLAICPVNSPHKGQWRGALMFSMICVWINGVNNREAGDLGRYRAHYDVIVMVWNDGHLGVIDPWLLHINPGRVMTCWVVII